FNERNGTSANGNSQQKKDPAVYAFGLNVGFSGFTVGGSIAYSKSWNLTSDHSIVFDVGLTYNMDAVTVGIDWSHGLYERHNNPANLDGGAGSNAPLDDAQIGASYARGPGISVDAFVGYIHSDPGSNNPAETTHGVQGGIGTAISF